MDHVEVAIKMLQSKINVIEFCSMAHENRANMNTVSRHYLTCSLEACGCFANWLDIRHSVIDRVTNLTHMVCNGTRSTATRLQCGKSWAASNTLHVDMSASKSCLRAQGAHQLPLPQPKSRTVLISPGVSFASTSYIGGGYFPNTSLNIWCCLSINKKGQWVIREHKARVSHQAAQTPHRPRVTCRFLTEH